MKRVVLLSFLAAAILFSATGYSQVVNEKTKKRISIGFGLATDIMMDVPSGIKMRAINHGATVFGTYNIPFGKSNFSFAIGVGLTSHNIYGNFIVNSTPDSTTLFKIPDSVDYKRSKIVLAYGEVPLEFRYKTKSKVTIGLGFKAGILLGSSSKYVGNGPIVTTNYTLNATGKQRAKFWGIENLEQFTYGPTVRVGYKWINVFSYYMISNLFVKDKGPDMYPISVGLLLMPF